MACLDDLVVGLTADAFGVASHVVGRIAERLLVAVTGFVPRIQLAPGCCRRLPSFGLDS
jgi:hypothetical protein